ncbi:hypothetical protein [Labrenzia sp. VG12]|uniref:hypothetical protein n=1 Tax=Labrenzia sp. VG12 TaxID=2021862 RepID=UPI0012FE5E59|nr:hypothetical protein [Labrenzia sp. VG12]
MSKLLAMIFMVFCLAAPLRAEEIVPAGTYRVVNTEGFSQKDGVRTALERDHTVGTAIIAPQGDNSLLLEINGSALRLFPLERGLAGLEWNAEDTALLHGKDIQALLDKASREEVPAWGADIAWPRHGQVQLVLFPLGERALTGFLISRPGSKTVVRQMEFRQVFGPSNRPGAVPRTEKSGS